MLGRFKEDIDSVFGRDPAAHSVADVLTSYPGVHAVWVHRLSHYLWTAGYCWLARFIAHLGRMLTGIEIHPGATIGRRLFIDHGMGVVIGETAVIGDDCTLYHGVTLGGTSWQPGKRHPTLGDGVVIGAGAKVLGPITIGAGARVGSNSVVLKPVPPGVTVVGIPGHIIGSKDPVARAETAGFNAYATSSDMPDPVADAINRMVEHIHALDTQVKCLQDALNAAGIDCPHPPLTGLGDCQIADDQKPQQ
ncbi:MAG: serine O-acetyltransferase [Methylococcaceae bacterium]|nr:serine O-acetyltransferase [Methylococcaceae bacterium]